MTEFDVVTTSLSRAIAEKTDAVISGAITLAIGDGWRVEDLAGRLHSVRYRGATFSTIFLDNKPILVTHDPELVTEHTEAGIVTRVVQNYQRL